MQTTGKRAHKAAQGQQWRLCARCFRPFDKSSHSTGCPKCGYQTVCTMRRGDSETTGLAAVPRVQGLGGEGRGKG